MLTAWDVCYYSIFLAFLVAVGLVFYISYNYSALYFCNYTSLLYIYDVDLGLC